MRSMPVSVMGVVAKWLAWCSQDRASWWNGLVSKCAATRMLTSGMHIALGESRCSVVG